VDLGDGRVAQHIDQWVEAWIMVKVPMYQRVKALGMALAVISASESIIGQSAGVFVVAERRDQEAGTLHRTMTDVVLPKMLSKEVGARVRGLRRDIEVLLMSGYAQPDPGPSEAA
jgi:hypothetical protein